MQFQIHFVDEEADKQYEVLLSLLSVAMMIIVRFLRVDRR
jgi:hypothetical protein